MEIFNNSDSAVIEVVYHPLNDEYWSINSKEGIPRRCKKVNYSSE